MKYEIAIPSYKRPETIKQKTLKLLEKYSNELRIYRGRKSSWYVGNIYQYAFWCILERRCFKVYKLTRRRSNMVDNAFER